MDGYGPGILIAVILDTQGWVQYQMLQFAQSKNLIHRLDTEALGSSTAIYSHIQMALWSLNQLEVPRPSN